jgi:hypothetical protein
MHVSPLWVVRTYTSACNAAKFFCLEYWCKITKATKNISPHLIIIHFNDGGKNAATKHLALCLSAIGQCNIPPPVRLEIRWYVASTMEAFA